jgi:hypothetical protein
MNVDSNGKNKGLVSYNTRYGTSALKKHVIDKHVKEYKRWGLFVVQSQKMVEIKDKLQRNER